MIKRIMLIVAVVVVHVTFVSRRQSLVFTASCQRTVNWVTFAWPCHLAAMPASGLVTLPPCHCEVTALTGESLTTPR
jgi:hypothetical protein